LETQQDFIPRLKDHILGRILNRDYEGDTYGMFTDKEQNTVCLLGEVMYQVKTLRINYTTYDVMCDGDVINPRTYPDIMVKSPETGPQAQLFWYARVIGIFHVLVSSSYPEATEKSFHRMNFLWVHWFGVEPGQYCYGFCHAHLPKIGFVESTDEYAFSFLDPVQVIRGVHIIPAFSEGHTSTLLPVTKSVARVLNPDEQDDWLNFYVNMLVTHTVLRELCSLVLTDFHFFSFSNRDMLMRHFGHGIGHMQYKRQHEIELEMATLENEEGEFESNHSVNVEGEEREWGEDEEDNGNNDVGEKEESDLASDHNSNEDDSGSDNKSYVSY
jgi:hypothetical protein